MASGVCLRPHHYEHAQSRLISEAKHGLCLTGLRLEGPDTTADAENDMGLRAQQSGQLFTPGDYFLFLVLSCLISEAKHGRAWLVLGWETAWEYQVL